jgi:hypothetical protein
MREPEVEAKVRSYLTGKGYEVLERAQMFGVDILAKKDDKTLAIEVKGDRPGHESSPGTINVDVMTLLGQLLLRKGMGVADEYAVAIRPVHTRLITKATPALRELRVKVFLVGDESLDEIA